MLSQIQFLLTTLIFAGSTYTQTQDHRQHTLTHTNTNTQTKTLTDTHTNPHTHTLTHSHTHTHTYTHTHRRKRAQTHTHTHIHTPHAYAMHAFTTRPPAALHNAAGNVSAWVSCPTSPEAVHSSLRQTGAHLAARASAPVPGRMQSMLMRSFFMWNCLCVCVCV